MITEEQRARRSTGIFSSDVARAMTGDEVQVYLEKIGEIPPADISGLEYVQLGNVLEPAGLDAFAATIKDQAKLIRSPDTLRHKQWAWLGAHLDAFYDRNPVEVKAVGVYNRRLWGEPGTDQVPDRVLWQTQTQMAVAGSRMAHVPVVFATEENLTNFIVTGKVTIDLYIVQRSEKMIEAIYDRCGDLWRCITEKTPPAVTRAEDAVLLYEHDKGTILQATEETLSDFETLRQLRASRDKIEERIDEYTGKLQVAMKTHGLLRHHGETLVTWRRNADSEILDADTVKAADPALWARCLRTRKGPRVFKVNDGAEVK